MKYTIAAKRTKYKGIWFRSRLEATWAAFFDQMRWPWEYEPFDLPGWSPDFLLVRPPVVFGSEEPVLVEVKPILFTGVWSKDCVPLAPLLNKIAWAMDDTQFRMVWLLGQAPFHCRPEEEQLIGSALYMYGDGTTIWDENALSAGTQAWLCAPGSYGAWAAAKNAVQFVVKYGGEPQAEFVPIR